MTSTVIATKAYVDTQVSAIEAQIASAGGVAGAQGAPGTPGSQIYHGTTTPSGSLGINGDYYLNTANSDLYKKSGGSWSVLVNIKGLTGAQGTQGAAGANGSTLQLAA